MSEQTVNQEGLSDSIAYCCLQAYLTINPETRRLFAEHGLKPVEYTVLKIVLANPTISQKRLGETIRVSPPNMATLLDAMEESGLVKRQQNPADKRAHILKITPLGHEKLHKSSACVEQAENQLPLTAKERKQLLTLLQKIFLA